MHLNTTTYVDVDVDEEEKNSKDYINLDIELLFHFSKDFFIKIL